MTRRLALYAALTLLGFALNVAAAWSISHWQQFIEPLDPVRGGVYTSSGEWLACTTWSRFGMETIRWIGGLEQPALTLSRLARAQTPPPTWSAVPRHPAFECAPAALGEMRGAWVESAYGWPVRSLRRLVTTRKDPSWCQAALSYDRIGLELPGGPHPLLPLRPAFPIIPIWTGLVIDTLVFTLPLIALVRGPRLARRLIRSWRDRCVDCGYPIGRSPICTECGSPLPSRRGADTPYSSSMRGAV